MPTSFQNASHVYIQHASSPQFDFQGRNPRLTRRDVDAGLLALRQTSREHRAAVPENTRRRFRYWSRPYPVREAVDAGNHVAVKSLLDHGHSVIAGDPLDAAVYAKRLNGPADPQRRQNILNELLRRGAVPSTTTFRLAGIVGDLDTFRLLDRHRPQSSTERPPDPRLHAAALHGAALKGHGAFVGELLERYRVPVNAEYAGQTALHGARGLAVNQLLRHGASLDVRSNLQWTPLEYAVSDNDVVKIRKLIQAGASPNQQNRQGRPVAFLAVTLGKADALRTLLELGADVHAIFDHKTLLTAVFYVMDHLTSLIPELIQILIDHGADVNAAPPGAAPPLIRAVQSSCDAFATIVRAGADVNVQYGGKSALHHAVDSGKKCMVEPLLKRGASLVPDAHGRLPSQYQMTPVVRATFQKYGF